VAECARLQPGAINQSQHFPELARQAREDTSAAMEFRGQCESSINNKIEKKIFKILKKSKKFSHCLFFYKTIESTELQDSAVRMKPKNTDTPRYQKQKLAAIRAAASVFSGKGFHGASTADIAARLGVKQGSLYYYFDSKEEALEEVCLYGLQAYVESMEVIATGDESFDTRLLAVVMNHLGRYRERSEALKVHNDERLYLPPERRVRLKKLGTHYRQQLEAIIDDGIEKGLVRNSIDSHFMAQSIIGMCNGLGEIIVRDPEADVFELSRKCTDLLLHGTDPQEPTGE
jgi:AcrR family transcriptional regulator